VESKSFRIRRKEEEESDGAGVENPPGKRSVAGEKAGETFAGLLPKSKISVG
jgi:hypothetical protein